MGLPTIGRSVSFPVSEIVACDCDCDRDCDCVAVICFVTVIRFVRQVNQAEWFG